MKQWKLDSASSALLMIVLGAVLFLMPGLALTTVLRLIGAVAAVIGGMRLAAFLRDRDRGAADDAAAGGALLWLFVRLQSSALRREVPQAT